MHLYFFNSLDRVKLNLLIWQCKIKRTAFSRFGFYPNTAAVTFHNFFTNTQSNPCSGIVTPCMQSLKDNKNALEKFRLDPKAIIADGKNNFAVFMFPDNFNYGCLFTTVFNGITNEVLQ